MLAATEGENEMEDGTAEDFVVGRGLLVVHLLPGEDETLLGWRDPLLLLHALLDPLDLVRGLDVDLNFLSGKGFHLDEHFYTVKKSV